MLLHSRLYAGGPFPDILSRLQNPLPGALGRKLQLTDDVPFHYHHVLLHRSRTSTTTDTTTSYHQLPIHPNLCYCRRGHLSLQQQSLHQPQSRPAKVVPPPIFQTPGGKQPHQTPGESRQRRHAIAYRQLHEVHGFIAPGKLSITAWGPSPGGWFETQHGARTSTRIGSPNPGRIDIF